MNAKLIDRWSYYSSGIFLLISWVLFYWETGRFLGSFFAAILAAALFWISWVLVRLVVLAFKD